MHSFPYFTDNVQLRESLLLAAVYIILASNLNLMIGYAGYVNFGNIVFFGLGGYITVYLVNDFHWPLVLAALLAGVGVSVVALVFGLGILRLRGAFFALATIGVNAAVAQLVTNFEPWGGATGIYLSMDAFGSARRADDGVVDLLPPHRRVMAASLLLSYAIKNSKFGLGLIAIGQNEDAAAVLGVPTPLYKALIYSISAFLPAIAGGFYFFKSGIIEPTGAFNLQTSIEAIVMVMLGGSGTVLGPALGAYLYEEMRGFLLTSKTFSDFQLVIAGVAAADHRAVCTRRTSGLAAQAMAAHATVARMSVLLDVVGLGKKFGGLQAVQDLNLKVSEGEILGLIGPNGAGKSTVFNLINGVYPPDAGRIVFEGKDITGEPPYRVARHGLARAHQIVQPLVGLTVLDNCTVGACFGRENLPLNKAREVAREVAARRRPG